MNGNTRAVRLSVAAQQRVLWLGVAIATAASWMYVLRAMRGHAGVHPKGMLPFAVPMWAAMMLGMMLPTAAPMFATYAAVARRDGQRYVSCLAAFVSAYLAVWIAFSIAGAWIQAGLASAGLVSAMGAASRPVGAGLLILSGAYQFTPIKQACLARCRTPLAFLMAEWRPGSTGAARLGLIHGRDCVLCCWAIMTLMFVVGLMNLWWMGMLTVLMLVEKAAPHGDRVARVAGMVMIACGGGLLYAG